MPAFVVVFRSRHVVGYARPDRGVPFLISCVLVCAYDATAMFALESRIAPHLSYLVAQWLRDSASSPTVTPEHINMIQSGLSFLKLLCLADYEV